jgi:hypothetical protein
MPTDAPVRYELREDREWQRIVDGWEWLPSGGGDWAKSGSCSYCSDTMGIRYGAGAVEFVEDLDEVFAPDRSPPEDRTVLFREDGRMFAWCDCSGEHKGRPSNSKGCGTWARILPPEQL